MRALTISELERLSGVPRSTIYYYVHEGLLPVAQKAAASRAVYAESHVELLELIARLKGEGLPLHAIRERLASRVASAGVPEVDLVAEQIEHVRQSILVVAARLFARKGYKRTRIADIIREAGVTPPVFYSHFPSKQELFVESFGVFVDWMHGFLESQLVEEPDPAARDLFRVRRSTAFST
jgi:AcrR family transcriptional regulator